jgi:hypothetical protein
MPLASTLTMTWPGPGDGTSRSILSNGAPGFGTWNARIFAMDVSFSKAPDRGRPTLTSREAAERVRAR